MTLAPLSVSGCLPAGNPANYPVSADAGAFPAIVNQLRAIKGKAEFFTGRRRKDAELYAILGECLRVCEDVASRGLVDDLRDLVSAKAADGRNRVYVEAKSDVYLIVGRYVFEGEANRAACWRYSATLREAAKRGISALNLPSWLASNGGANALFRTRPVARRSFYTRTLHLTSAVEAFKGGEITLTLRARHDGFFDVVPA